MSELYDLTSGVDEMKHATEYALNAADDLARGACFEDHCWTEMESICAKLREIEAALSTLLDPIADAIAEDEANRQHLEDLADAASY